MYDKKIRLVPIDHECLHDSARRPRGIPVGLERTRHELAAQHSIEGQTGPEATGGK
jgi:hypothetical protein